MDAGIIIVISILVITAVLLITDILRLDVIAILCLLALAWTGVLDPLEALSGFSSNAVVTIISVMIMGKGIARTGLMVRFSRLILKIAGNDPPGIVAVISAAVGLMSAFIQNIGSASLFLPAILDVSRRRKIPASRLIMPIGFTIILSGTLTMIGSGPLLMVNDFLMNSSLEPYGLFAVTPVGLSLLFIAIAFFFLFGQFLLPRHKPDESLDKLQKTMIEDWHLSSGIFHYSIPASSPIVGKSLEETGIWQKYSINILALSRDKQLEYAPWRETKFKANQSIALMGEKKNIVAFADAYGLLPEGKAGKFERLADSASAGFTEVVVPPRSAIAGQSLKKYNLRKRYGVEPILLHHRGEIVRGDFSDVKVAPGDIFIVHGLWDRIAEMKKSFDFVLLTPVDIDEKDTSKASIALICFALAIVMSLAGFPISISFLSGAIAMILMRVLPMDEAYQAVDWKVIFFIAGLIPLGLAMQNTGAAALLASNIISLVGGSGIIVILLVISIITTLFSLFMSNVGAAVILFPIVISIAPAAGIDPRPLVLLVAVSAANSFLLPTHQVNALLKTSGGYRNSDYVRAGWGLTLLFLLATTGIFYLLYL